MALRAVINVYTKGELVDYVVNDHQLVVVPGNTVWGDTWFQWYYYDTTSTATPDGDLVIKPTAVMAGGRWIKVFTSQTPADWNSTSGITQIVNKPSLATVATTGSYNDLVSKPSIPAAQVNSDWTAVSGLAQILNKPTIPSPPSFSNTPSITIQTVAAAGNGSQVSTTRNAIVNYSVTIGSTVSLSGNSTGYVVLEICSTNSSTASDWVEIGRAASGQSGTLVVGLVLNQTGGGQIGGVVPAGYYRRVRSVNTSGTPTYTYNSGQEVLI